MQVSIFFFSSRRRHTRFKCDWSSDVCSSDLKQRTILGLPAQTSSSLFLPKVGAGAIMNEEETRESLRRFIRDWQELIGSDPAKLSLIERTEKAWRDPSRLVPASL